MRRRRAAKTLSSDSSDEEPPEKISPKKLKESPPNDDDSSSDSDIGNYLQRADKIDLSSAFFNVEKPPPSFDQIESEIFSGVNRLEDSESEDEAKGEVEAIQAIPSTSKVNFGQLHEYTKKLEEAKRHVEEYNARRNEKEKEMNVENLLAAGESKDKVQDVFGDLHSSDFESCSDSDKEGWEEVKEQKENKSLIPKEGIEITVGVPSTTKQKKEVDVLAVIKRRINKVRKENQVLVHKVHLLCWIAHGNFVNSMINSQNVLGVALSLLPSEKCYPPSRTDLSYLEQITKWYNSTIQNIDKEVPKDKSLKELIQEQVTKKAAYNKTMLVYIFVAILRSLGIACRLVLSFQVEPIRPPNSELLSLSTKNNGTTREKSGKVAQVTKGKDQSKMVPQVVLQRVETPPPKETKPKVLRSRSTTDTKKEAKEGEKAKTRSKSATSTLEPPSVPAEKKKLRTGEKTGKTRSKSTSSTLKPPSEGGEKKKSPTGVKKTNTRSKSASSTLKPASEGGEKKKSPTGVKKTNTRSKSASSTLKPASEGGEKKKSPTGVKKTNTRSKSTSSSLKSVDKKKSATGEKKTKSASKGPKSPTEKKSPAKTEKKKKSSKKIIKIKLPSPTKSRSKSPSTPSKKRTRSKEPIPQLDGANDSPPKPDLKKLKKTPPSCPLKTHPKRLKTITKYRDSDSEEEFSSKNDSPKILGANLKKLKNHKSGVAKDVQKLVNKGIKEQVKRRSVRNTEDTEYVPIKKKHHESDDDFSPKVKVKRRVQMRKDDEEKVKKKQGVDVWAEVFCESEEKWICVDVVKGQIFCMKELHSRATQPVSYIVAWNNDSTLKDVSRRYCPTFNTTTRKLRVDDNWWSEALKPFMGDCTARDLEEDDQLERQHLEKPLPTTISEYKNHPLYALKRHLLKFEALYPPDAPTVGFIRKEAVYLRRCVYTLHSRDIWLKHAKVVKPGEQPYNIVKARPKWDKLSNSLVTGELLEIFGPWQTQDYDPPTAENGVVPRNAFGNVELFKPCMLPKKTVHLQLPGLNKVARRLNIDCAPALTGFDFHGGWNHPTYDGYIVCEEFADELVAAWDIEQQEIEKREQEKIDKRVYGNWRRLIRGLLIRERLKVKYEFGEPSTSGGGKKKGKGLPKLATKKK